ncbi:uncharacterized protein LOC107813590 [Nicotiana tabacum]|uniref:Uncharacterized protein LOC107813590 n=1 Tax=Nicotiana tabacum TaxID=4097 RepID=A0A1S4BZM7_TOBAC|nr:uncharacterized protein LOC104103669 [Nicotiana tomentosiformis]XP_016494355.1 PREDICTED: uncharacterized protein LOC107813590 [Nicotiana tabacum]
MDLFDDTSIPSSPKTTQDDQMEPGLLLEESWFFGNLLDRKSRMLRCYSDPCPSSKNTQDMLAGKSLEETFSSLQKLPQGEKLNLDSRRSNPKLQRASKSSNLQRVPSLPVFVDYKDEIQDEESDFSMGKLIRQASINNVKVSPPKQSSQVNLPKAPQSSLQRAPSLPVFAEREENHEEENDFSMGKLIRQASLNHARVLPPKHTSKGLTKSPTISSIIRQHSRRRQEQESKTRNSSSEIEDLQGFKKLDLNYEKKDSIPKLPNTIPGFKEKNKKKSVGLSELDKIRRPPYSPEDHMKEKIKFWARTVASNVR